jgi:hypothetical protein
MTAALFPRPVLRRLARRVVAGLRAADPGGLTLPDLKTALGLPSRARLVGQVVRTLVEAGVLSRTYRCNGSLYRLLRQPTREEMAAPPREARPIEPANVLQHEVAVKRSETSRLVVELRGRGGKRWIALVHEIRPPANDWHTRRTFNVAVGEVGLLVDALLEVAR